MLTSKCENFRVDIYHVTAEPTWNPPFEEIWDFNAFRKGEGFAFQSTHYSNLYRSEEEANIAGQKLLAKYEDDYSHFLHVQEHQVPSI